MNLIFSVKNQYRFFVKDFPSFHQGAKYIPEDSLKLRIQKILRMKNGNSLLIMNGKGAVILGNIIENGQFIILKDYKYYPPLNSLIVFQAVVHKKQMELIVQQSVPLGVKHLIFFKSNHSKDITWTYQLKERFTQITYEAMEQSGNPYLTKIYFFDALEEIFHYSLWGKWQKHWIHFGLAQNGQSIHLNDLSPSAALWIGPEGDFSTKEIALLTPILKQWLCISPFTLRSHLCFSTGCYLFSSLRLK